MTEDVFLEDVNDRALVPWKRELATIDVVEEEQKRKYFIVQELKTAWQRLYQQYILRAIYNEEKPEEAARRLREIVKALDGAMINLVEVDRDYNRLIKHLEALERRFQGIASGEAINKAKFRKHAFKATKAFDRMAEKVACPAPLRRFLQSLWGQVKLVVPEDEQQRLKTLAVGALENLSRNVGGALQVDPAVLKAFQTLGLGLWASQQEMEQRYRYLARQYHPDINPGRQNDQMMTDINNARDLLLGHYSP